MTLGQKTLIMGIVNVTPDSFSDGGEAYSLNDAVNRAFQLELDGADILDIGGESTRPGSASVSLVEELRRVIPVIEALQGRLKIPISVDTCKSLVARRALEAGAKIINDISSGMFDSEMPSIAREFNAGVVLMHMQGTPRTMQKNPQYDDLMTEVRQFLSDAIKRFTDAGVDRENILVDPGIGFGKTLQHNLELIRRSGEFQDLAAGVLIGPSRKSFLGLLTDNPVDQRVESTVSSAVCAAIYGADIVRVHDVEAVNEALKVADAIKEICSFEAVK
jgi:dihydropteroate synthase